MWVKLEHINNKGIKAGRRELEVYIVRFFVAYEGVKCHLMGVSDIYYTAIKITEQRRY